MKKVWKIVPWVVVAVFVAEIIAVMIPKKDGEFHVRKFGSLPVLLNGRFQPFDSVARNALLQIRSTGDLPLEQIPSWQFWRHAKKLKSTEWLLEVMARPQIADTRPIFLIHHSDILGELKLTDKGVERSGLRYYSFQDLTPAVSEIAEQGRKASQVKSEERTTFQKQILKLSNAMMLYQRLKVTLQPEGTEDFRQDLALFKEHMGAAQAAVKASEEGSSFDKESLRKVAGPLRNFQMMATYSYPLIVPPADPGVPADQWQNLGESLVGSVRRGEIPASATWFVEMGTAYKQGKAAEFNRALGEYASWLQPKFPKQVKKAAAEFYFNSVKAFLHATIMYIVAMVLAGIALLTFGVAPVLSETTRRSAIYLVILAGLLHTFGLVFRMVLEGRPPVTNLYSSAIFIGWGTMVLGIILERIYRVGLGAIMASSVGFVTLLIAHNLALGGDTMEMLRAVLDTNFWLATHVVVITLGYASNFAAGMLAVLYIFLGLFTPLLTTRLAARGATPGGKDETVARSRTGVELGEALSKMVYGIICFATLFSFVGTVLGGIWADQSWGRFWGWDPKENGALLIVLWNAIVLHARWGRMVRDRGVMNLAIAGNIITSFSWFGVNMLGIGLHSYGFMDAAFKWLMLFMVSQAVVIGLGMLPLQYWRSFRGVVAGKKPAGPGGRTASAVGSQA